MLTTRVLIAAAVAFLQIGAVNQPKAQPRPPEVVPAQSATRIFKSGGISAAISGLNVDRFKVEFQLVVKNDRPTPVLFSPILMIGSPEMAATTSNGVVYVPQNIAGAAPCIGTNSSVSVSLNTCMKEFQTSAMTRLEPGDIASVNVSYRLYNGSKPFKDDDKISTAVKFLVRTAPQDDGSLEAAAKGKNEGAPSIVTINFPLVPISSQS